MTEEERPVHHEHNCTTGETTLVPLTDKEWAEHRRRALQHSAAVQAEQQQKTELARAAAEHPDPLVQELAKRAGIIP